MIEPNWILRVDRSELTLSVTGGRLVTAGSRVGFVAGVVSAVPGSKSGDVAPVATADVLLSLQRDGDEDLAHLRGQFVLGVADRDRSTVRVLRDPLGAHPLFYATTPQAYLFAASPLALVSQPGVSREVNRTAIADHLCKRWPLRHETFFQAVARVPPGWRILISRSGLDARRYWNPVDLSRQIEFMPDEEIERFGSVLELATSRALTGRQPAVFLSGGFDSVSVASVACDIADRQSSARPIALSLSFPDPECGETEVQTAVAERLGMPLSMVDFHAAAGPAGLLRNGLDLNDGLSAPLFNTWLPAYATLLDRGIQSGVDTVITGEGGDEWLGTSPFLAADLLRRGDIGGLTRLLRTWKRSYPVDWLTVMRGTLWTYALRPLIGQLCHTVAPDAWDAHRARKAVSASPKWISQDPTLRAAQYARAHDSLTAANPPHGFYTREASVFLDHPLMSWLFEEQFAFGAQRGVRFVHPYWDPDLVAHMYRVPPERLNEGSRSKALVRRTVANRFPGLGFRRQRKIPAVQFFADLVTREAPAIAAEVDDFRALASLDLVRPTAAREYLASTWGTSPKEIGRALNLVTMEVWLRKHLG